MVRFYYSNQRNYREACGIEIIVIRLICLRHFVRSSYLENKKQPSRGNFIESVRKTSGGMGLMLRGRDARDVDGVYRMAWVGGYRGKMPLVMMRVEKLGVVEPSG